MSVKINFAPEGTVSNDYIIDFGLGYSDERGYGWVTQASLDDSPTPADITLNTRDRNSDDDSPSDSLIHLQYPTEYAEYSPVGNPLASAWEYTLANGMYRVTVSVGDSDYLDSNHVINLEGQSVISSFVPTADRRFTTTTALVEVVDGKLTLDAIGGENTKLNFVEIVSASVKVNFGVANIDVPEGYIQDVGNAYSDERGYGWVTQASLNDSPTPADITLNTRDRNSDDDSPSDSLIHLQYPTEFAEYSPVGNPLPSAWEYTLANGMYEVTVSVGDSDYLDSNHVINLEGQSVISGFVPTADRRFTTTTAVVEVADGKLTLDAIGGENTKLNFVEITPVLQTNSDRDLPENGVNINFGTVITATPEGYIQDIGRKFSSDRGYGWVTQNSTRLSEARPLNVVANGRDRNIIDDNSALDSLIHMQYPTGLNNSGVTTPAAWEYELSNGSYEVTVSVGDASFTDSNHVINVEGENVIAGFAPDSLSNDLFTTGTATVEVTDGRLTVDAIGGENTKLNYISIVPVDETIADI